MFYSYDKRIDIVTLIKDLPEAQQIKAYQRFIEEEKEILSRLPNDKPTSHALDTAQRKLQELTQPAHVMQPAPKLNLF